MKKGDLMDHGLLLMRLALAVVFIMHGWQKLGDMTAFTGLITSLGIPAFMAWVVALVEFLGGLAMLVGMYTRWAGYLLALNMLGAITFVHWSKGFFNAGGGYEFPLVLLLIALGIAKTGPGKHVLKLGK